MTEATGTLRDYQMLRWRQLAEKRLAHVTELFDSGRWSLYFREAEFLDVIRQSKALVETWRRLTPPEPDARLPQSPFATPAEEIADRIHWEAADAEADAPATMLAMEPEVAGESDARDWEPAAPVSDFQLESELATIALQRLRDTVEFPSRTDAA